MTNQMTSRERFFASLAGKEVDRKPVINPTSTATKETCDILGFSFKDVHLDTDKTAALAAFNCEQLGFDSVMPYYSVVLEAAAFGADIDWGSDVEMPNQKRPVFSNPNDFVMPTDFLDKLPIKTVLDSIKLLRKKLGDDAVILGKVMGPWTLSYHLHGIEDFLIETITDPDMVQEFLQKFKEISIKFADAQFEAGADVVTIADHATADLVGPATYKEFLMPVHKEINEYFKDRTTILHCCGNTLDRIAMFREGGFNIFHFDSKNDISKALIEASDMQLAGCIANSEILLNGTVEDVRRQTIEVAASGVKFVAPECAIPLRVKNVNLHEISKTVRSN